MGTEKKIDSIAEKLEEINRLTAFWYSYVGMDYHKDRDCHWYINTVWSYGEPCKYEVQHFGYIGDLIELTTDSYEGAVDILLDTLREQIEIRKAKEEHLQQFGINGPQTKFCLEFEL